jgi:hypothetical protein
MARGRGLPKHPFRDSAVLYGALAGIVVAVGILTNAEVLETAAVACAFFVIATGYSWWRFRQRLAEGGRRSP